MSYPVSTDVFSTKVDGVDTFLAAHMNAVQSSLVAVETELGTGLRGTLTNLAARLAVGLNNDGTLKTAGITSLPSNTVDTASIQALAVTAAKIANNTITAAQIAANTITAAQIANGTIGALQIASGAVGTTQIANQAITNALLASGAVSPENEGLTVWNATGSTLTAGQLVYVSGWNVANTLPQPSLAVNNVANSRATYIVTASILNGASGVVKRHWTSAANLNTGGSSVGAAVYQDTTAGGWTLTAPVAQTSRQQIVGHVVVVDAAVGQIDFDLASNPGSVIGRNDIQATAVGTAALSTIYTVQKISIPMGTIGTAAGVYEGIGVMSYTGTISAIHFVSSDGLLADNANFITLAGINKDGGGGAVALLTVTSTNTTKATGGQAVVAYTWNNLAGTGATTVLNDVISFTATVSGTLPNSLRNCYMVLTLVVS